MVVIRGAITVKENTRQAILDGTKKMLEKIIEANDLELSKIVSVIFTATRDLTKAYPAVAARELNMTECSLMCVQEMYVEGSLEKCLRVAIHAEIPVLQKNVKHIYLEEAKKLRPDLFE